MQNPLETILLLDTLLETFCYGLFVCIFGTTVLLQLSSSPRKDFNNKVMMGFSTTMFIVATFHIVMNMYRTIFGYSELLGTPNATLAYLGELRPWHHILEDIWVPTQEDLGGAAAIYRVWVVWGYDWKVIALPTVLLMINIVSGYMIIGKFVTAAPGVVIFDASINQWLKTFFSITALLNIMTTALVAYKIWRTHRISAPYRAGKGILLPIMQIIVESASLQLIVQLIILILYSLQSPVLNIFHDAIVPIIGITFNAITLRMRLHMRSLPGKESYSTGPPTSITQTIGSIPMHRVDVHISTEVENDTSSAHDTVETGNKEVLAV